MSDKTYTIDDLPRLEESFAGSGDSAANYGWSPLPLTIFTRLMDAATKRIRPGASFLEAGSGIGTKLFLAREKYGLWEFGVENNQYMLNFAQDELGVRCFVGDVAEIQYGYADIVYISRPYKVDKSEIAYEEMVHLLMREGSILIAAWAAVKPPWHIMHREGQHGVWRKPMKGETVAPRAVPEDHPQTMAEYKAMIRRTDGTDPLVKEPGPGRK